MIRRTSRDIMMFGLALACAAAIAGTAVAQLPTHEVMTITTDDVYVRSGSTDAYYPFGRLKSGHQVAVIAVDDSWAEVLTIGPAFKGFFGYIEVLRDSGTVSLASGPDGTTLTTVGKVSLLGSNLNSRRPADSWKAIWKPVPIGTRFVVLDTVRATGSTFYKVLIEGKAAHGWVSEAHLRQATPTEARAFERAIAGMPAVAASAARKPMAKPADKPGPASERTSNPVLPTDERAAPVVPGLDNAWAGPPLPEGYEFETPAPALNPAPRSVSKPVATPPAKTTGTGRETPAVITDRGPVIDPFDASAQTPGRDPVPERMPAPAAGQDEPKPAGANGRPELTDPVATPARPITPAAPRATSYRAELADLEAAFELLKKEPIETAEVLPLRSLYLDLVNRSKDSRRVTRYAEARAEQLQIWSELQKRRQEVHGLKARIESASDDVQRTQRLLDRGGDYIAVGRLLASTIFDGQRLPMLYRLQDAGTGRTVAYVKRSDEFDLVALLDQFIGIVGEKKYDPALQLHVIEPIRHIDILAPKEGVTDTSVGMSEMPTATPVAARVTPNATPTSTTDTDVFEVRPE